MTWTGTLSRLINRLGDWGVRMAGVFTITGFLGSWFWLFDLTSHFRLTYLIILLGGTFIHSSSRRWTSSAVCFVLALVNLWLILPIYEQAPPGPSRYVSLKIAHANVFLFNQNKNGLFNYLVSQNADIVEVCELTRPWEHALLDHPIYKAYPYRLVNRALELALLSRYPFTKAMTDRQSKVAGYQSLILETPAGRINLIPAHLANPVRPVHHAQQMEQSAMLVKTMTQSRYPVIIFGDLNTSPWGTAYQTIMSTGRLKDTRQGLGLQPSWPALFPPLWIPIDHVLISQGIGVTHRSLGPWLGSDHLPVLVELALPLPTGKPESR